MSIKGERNRDSEKMWCFNISKMINALPVQRRQWTLIFGACLRRKAKFCWIFFLFISFFIFSVETLLKWGGGGDNTISTRRFDKDWIPVAALLCKTFGTHIIICTIFSSKSRETDTSFQFEWKLCCANCYFFRLLGKIPKWKTQPTNSAKVEYCWIFYAISNPMHSYSHFQSTENSIPFFLWQMEMNVKLKILCEEVERTLGWTKWV